MAASPRWLTDDEQALWRLYLAAGRKIDRVLDETLQSASGLSSAQFAVMVALSEAENHTLRLRDICSALDWDRSRTSHQITRMERRGLVTKTKPAGDARGVEVTLSPEGYSRLEAVSAEHVEVVRRLVFDHLTEDQKEPLARYLRNILAVEIPVHTPKEPIGSQDTNQPNNPAADK